MRIRMPLQQKCDAKFKKKTGSCREGSNEKRGRRVVGFALSGLAVIGQKVSSNCHRLVAACCGSRARCEPYAQPPTSPTPPWSIHPTIHQLPTESLFHQTQISMVEIFTSPLCVTMSRETQTGYRHIFNKRARGGGGVTHVDGRSRKAEDLHAWP